MSQQVVMCDQFTDRVAVAHFRWDWGEEGNCSAEYQQLLVQKSVNLERQVYFAPLALAESPLMERSERHALIAAKLAADSEALDVSTRNAKLYTQNQELRADIARLNLLIQEGNAQIERRDVEIVGLVKARDRYAVEAATVVNDLQRANLLLEAGPSTQLEAQLVETTRNLEKARQQVDSLEVRTEEARLRFSSREDELLHRINQLETELAAAPQREVIE